MLIWLSFADPAKPKGSQFLGTVITEIEAGTYSPITLGLAITKAWKLGLNPGGEVAAFPIPAEAEEYYRPYLNRLITTPEINIIGDRFTRR